MIKNADAAKVPDRAHFAAAAAERLPFAMRSSTWSL
jgi:hypothetical protein